MNTNFRGVLTDTLAKFYSPTMDNRRIRMHSKNLDLRFIPICLLSKKHRTKPVAITSFKYSSSMCILSASKSAALAATAAQVKDQSWCSRSRLILAG